MGRGKWTGNKDKARYAHNKVNGQVSSPLWRKGRSLVTMRQQSNSLSDSQLFWEGKTWQYLPITLHALAVCHLTLSLFLPLFVEHTLSPTLPLSPCIWDRIYLSLLCGDTIVFQNSHPVPWGHICLHRHWGKREEQRKGTEDRDRSKRRIQIERNC